MRCFTWNMRIKKLCLGIIRRGTCIILFWCLYRLFVQDNTPALIIVDSIITIFSVYLLKCLGVLISVWAGHCLFLTTCGIKSNSIFCRRGAGTRIKIIYYTGLLALLPYFVKHHQAVAVSWNGVKGPVPCLCWLQSNVKRLFLNTLHYLVICGRFRGHQCGCALSRSSDYYLSRPSQEIQSDIWLAIRLQHALRHHLVQQGNASQGMLQKRYIFCPLQVSGDSQLTLYGRWVYSMDEWSIHTDCRMPCHLIGLVIKRILHLNNHMRIFCLNMHMTLLWLSIKSIALNWWSLVRRFSQSTHPWVFRPSFLTNLSWRQERHFIILVTWLTT